MGEIRSGLFGEPAARQGQDYEYKAERLGGVLIERVIWREPVQPGRLNDIVIADRGFIWFRFWLQQYRQVVERYYGPDGQLLGTNVDVCLPPACDEAGCRAGDLLLDLWIAPDGAVTVYNEDAFEAAARQGTLSGQDIQYGEEHLRRLTTGIAHGKFPPALVRNWQIDLRRMGPAARGEALDGSDTA